MISRWLRRHMHVLTPALLWVARRGVTPNLLTSISLAAILASGFLLAGGNRVWGGAVLLFGALLDAIDGELARVMKRDGPRGALLDSLADHCGDLAVFLGLLWPYLSRNSHTEVILIFLALFGSMLGSQIRSRAAMVGVETKSIGLSTRFERMLILIIGLFSGEVSAALWVLAALNIVSALQRLVCVFRPFSASLLLLLLYGACAAIPKIEEVQEPKNIQDHPKIVGPKGEISSRRSKAILKRLERQAENTDLLQKHTLLMESISGNPLAAGNQCTLLIDGPAAIAAMLQAIEGARDHVNFETYIFEDGETGQVFADLLLRKQAEGVQVNLMYDSVGCKNVPSSFFQRLRDGGIQALEFNPMNPFKTRRKWLLTNRDHRKILIVDGRIAFTGGVNISDVYSSGSVGRYIGGSSREPWRDTHVRIEGPAVAELQKLFVENWSLQKGPELAPRNYFPALEKHGDDLVRVVGTLPGQKLPATYLMYLAAFTYADKSIHLTSAYFVPDDELVEALQKAAGRGVDVKIVLPSSSDIGMVFYAGRSYYTGLLKSGVRLYERRGSVLHAKTAVVDGVWSTVGSTNMDLWSFVRNDEVNTIILGRHFAGEMEAMFERDLAESKPIVLSEWRHRPAGERKKEWVARLFRYFL